MATTNKSFRVKNGLTVEGGALYPAAGTTSIAPIVLTSGTNLTSATAGAMEFDGTRFYLTPSTTRKAVALTDSTGATLDSSITASSLTSVGTLANLTVTNTIVGSVSGSAGSVANSITFNTSGGATAGATYNGSAAKTIDYSTVGAAASSHSHGNISSSGGIGSTANLVVVTTTSGAVTVAGAPTSASTQFLRGDLTWVVPTDTNYYPTALTYTGGTTAGPVATIAMSGASNITADAIPSASATASGIVTTGAQTFAGTKTLTSPSIATSITTASTSFDLVNTTATTVNIAGAGTAVAIGASTGNTTVNNNLIVTGNLTVNGTTNTINSTTVTVDDKNIELGSVATPTDTTADGGGITLKGATDKTIIWDSANANWTSSENWNLATGKVFKINNVSTLTATTLGSAVVNSSLTKVGALSGGTAGFVKVDASGNLTSDSSTYLTAASPSLTGTVTYNSTAATITISDSTTGTTAKTVSSVFASTAYKGVEILVKGTNGSNIEIIKALAVFDGTNVYITRYGEVYTSADLFDIDFTYTTTNVNFVFTPVAGTTGTTTFNAVLTLLAA